MSRPKGTPNRISSVAKLKLAKLKCDPIERSVACANILFDSGEIKDAGRIYLDLINYVVPKLKMVDTKVEHSGEIKNTALALSESLQLIADAARDAETVSNPSPRTH
jgi:hypothetical protein